jgi:hypothetical protein
VDESAYDGIPPLSRPTLISRLGIRGHYKKRTYGIMMNLEELDFLQINLWKILKSDGNLESQNMFFF